MNPLDPSEIRDYAAASAADFYRQRVEVLTEVEFDVLMRTNPYLLRTQHLTRVHRFVSGQLDALLSAAEEKLLGDFLKGLAILVVERTCGGRRSSAPGTDLEFFHRRTHYVVTVEPGPNWGTGPRHRRVTQGPKIATSWLVQKNDTPDVQPVLGICCGNEKTSHLGGYLKVVGQNFWYLISENEALYTDIIELVGRWAEEQDDEFNSEYGKAINRFTKEFIDRFCDTSGAINWVKLVEFNSGNYDLDQFLSPTI